ncbi:HEPN domain-containing protein [Murimonas intestini]|uniref:HEPN domain-containing protein n=1 Tax=Murimonas intestini TaxID=1337051 RepID=UPI0011DE23E6|nr:HEPN domain-containing protein [Murimonas intestini]
MQPSKLDLSMYRMQRAKEDLRAAQINLENNLYKASINRSYYSIFHAIRSVNVLDDFDASKHSSVIAHFNQYHVHTGDFERGTYKIIDSAYRIREKCDYSDFVIVSREEAETQILKAEIFLKEVQNYLKHKNKQL